MIICVCTFTDKGMSLSQKIEEAFPEHVFCHRKKEEELSLFVEQCFKRHLPVLFIGACGIAVRAIAPYVCDKLYDSPILVMDEGAQHVIPILSGHMGGANELARMIEKKCGIQAVITTATDVNEMFSVDVFAKNNGFHILNRDGIMAVSGKLLKKEAVSIWIDPKISFDASRIPRELTYVSERKDAIGADILILTEGTFTETKMTGKLITLVSKEFVLGIGCKKEKSFEALQEFVMEQILNVTEEQKGPEAFWWRRCYQIASIDLKKKEVGLLGLSQFYHIPFVTFSAKELMEVPGEFSASSFVSSVTGVDCVSERAAVLASGAKIENLLLKKVARDGMTLAVAKRNVRITDW